MFKKFLFIVIALVIFFAALLGYVAFDIWHQNKYKILLHSVEFKEKNLRFLLFTDVAGFGDRAWYVYEIPLESDVTKKIKEAHNKDNVLFWNYSEAGNSTKNPKLEILNNKYLLFSRGSFYHSLYDIDNKLVLVNYESPWASFVQPDRYKLYGGNAEHEKLMELMDKWVYQNIHSKIEILIR